MNYLPWIDTQLRDITNNKVPSGELKTMENLTTDNASTDDLLDEINNEKAIAMIPVMVYLFILMVMGLLGNTMVCYYYGCKTKRTTHSIFICTVAIYDLISCSMSIPIELVDLRFLYVFTDSGACKFLRFINHFASIGSAFTLLIIAVDRYRRICQPFKKQLTIRDAKVACFILVLTSVFFSWPSFLLYGTVPVNLKSKQGTDIIGSDCTTIRESSYQIYLWVYNGVHLTGFLFAVGVLSVMYSLVGRVLLKHKLHQQKYTKPQPSNENTNSGASAQTNLSDQTDAAVETNLDATINTEADPDDVPKSNGVKLVNMNPSGSVADVNNVRTSTTDQFDIKTVKYTLIMLVITIVFVVSFLPYLILVIWRAAIGGHEENVLSNSGLVAFNFGIRSYFLNSAINPMTYGFFNSKFRNFFFKVLCPCCTNKSDKKTVALSSESGNS